MISDVPPSQRGGGVCCCFGGSSAPVQPVYNLGRDQNFGGSIPPTSGQNSFDKKFATLDASDLAKERSNSSRSRSSSSSSSSCCTFVKTVLVFAFSMALPSVYFIAAYLNIYDGNLRATKISQVEGSACVKFQKIDSAWILLICAAGLGAACAILQAAITYKDYAPKLTKLWQFLCLGPFICSCMLLDIWVNIPDGCVEELENSFDNVISLWLAIQIAAYAFMIGMCLGALACLMACCACFCCGMSLAEMALGGSDDDIEMPEMFKNPAAWDAKFEKMGRDLESAIRQIEVIERDAANGDRDAQARMNYLNNARVVF